MPVYDFICNKCGRVEEVEMGMKDVGVVKVYCKPCNSHIDEWVMLSFLDHEELAQLNLIEMVRYYNPAEPTRGFVKGGTFGSLIDTKKFRATNQRPNDWFIEQREKKRDANERIEQGEGPARTIKIKETED